MFVKVIFFIFIFILINISYAKLIEDKYCVVEKDGNIDFDPGCNCVKNKNCFNVNKLYQDLNQDKEFMKMNSRFSENEKKTFLMIADIVNESFSGRFEEEKIDTALMKDSLESLRKKVDSSMGVVNKKFNLKLYVEKKSRNFNDLIENDHKILLDKLKNESFLKDEMGKINIFIESDLRNENKDISTLKNYDPNSSSVFNVSRNAFDNSSTLKNNYKYDTIVNDKNRSIWTIISERYLKKFFNLFND